MFYLLKIVIALVVIIGATELSKKNTTLAAILFSNAHYIFCFFYINLGGIKRSIADQWTYTRNHNVYFARYPFFIFV
jgi:hypothetical protein